MARAILLALMALGFPFSDRLAGNAWLYMFAHANLAHLAVNAITLWSFGKPAERDLGPAQMLALFMVGAVVGGAAQSIITPDAAIMGASAGIFAVVCAVVAMNPKARVGLPMLMFPGPIVIAVLVVASAVCMAFQLLPAIAHAAHLGGIAVGLAWTRK